MRSHRTLLAIALFGLFAARCAPAISADGGADAAIADIGNASDVPRDRERVDAPMTGVMFSHCTVDANCPSGGTCVTAYAGGLCSRACTTDVACGPVGICVGSLCRPHCPNGGGECGPAQACDLVSNLVPDRLACMPSCFTAPPAGTPACNAPLQCNAYLGTGTCDESAAPTGRVNGEPCLTNDDCRGVCLAEVEMGESTGDVDGYCASFGRLPDPAGYAGGSPLLQSNCPMGSVVIPLNNNTDTEGDAGICLRSCATLADCRRGYGCFYFEITGTRSSTGFCDAINCVSEPWASMPNHRCPAGFACIASPNDGGVPSATCVRSPVSDAGVTDASAADVGSDG